MTNRTGTYVAFVGCGETDPTKSDIKYYNLLKKWKKNKNIDFSFTDSHDKTYKVKDESSDETLKKRLKERLKLSKNFLLIITDKTKKYYTDNLNFEIATAMELELPFIITYPCFESEEYLAEEDIEYNLSELWPEKLKKIIEKNKIKAIHISFKLEQIKESINRFTINNNEELKCSECFFKKEK